jgi:hypothetical protein
MKLSGSAATGVIACTYLFVASFAPSWGPVSWVYPPELYPLRVRGKAVALSTSANWAFNTALGAFVPPAFATIRYKVYIVFGVFNFCMMVHAFFMFPETAGKTLEDTEKMFEDPNGIKYIGTPAWKVSRPLCHHHARPLLTWIYRLMSSIKKPLRPSAVKSARRSWVLSPSIGRTAPTTLTRRSKYFFMCIIDRNISTLARSITAKSALFLHFANL